MAARRYGRKLRRTAAGTAVAAAAMAALSASQAPGFLPVAHAATQGDRTVQPPPGPQIDGGSPYITELPPLGTQPGGPGVPTPGGTPGVDSPAVPAGGGTLPATVLDAYQRAQAALALSDPGCHLPWQLLAAIGQVESGQARGGEVDSNGTTYKPILGPVLDGNGFANISDTDGGAYDGDALHDRAVGPMQFIPSTWRTWGADGNGDGVKNPNNVYDAALAAAHYLCADGRDLAVPHDRDRAILGYNHSQAYLRLVTTWYEHFMNGGAVAVPDAGGTPAGGDSPAGGTDPVPRASGTPSTAPTTPAPDSTSDGSVTVPGGPASPSPVLGSTAAPTPPSTTWPPTTSGGPVTTPPTTAPTTPPTTPPTTAPTTTPPSTPPTTPPATGCTPEPTATASPSGTPAPTGSGTPCPTDPASATPSPSNSASAVAGPAITAS